MTIRRVRSATPIALVLALLAAVGVSQTPCSSQLATVTTGGTATQGGAFSWPGVFFDVVVTSAGGVSICGMSLPVRGGTVDFNFEVTPNSYVGKDTDPTQWHRAGAATATTVPTATTNVSLTPITFLEPVYLAPGSYGISIWCNNFFGSSTLITTPGAGNVFVSPDLLILPTPGLARTDQFAGAALPNENFTGILHYSPVSATSEAGLGFFANGCLSTWGVADVYPAGLPRIGQAFGVDIYNLPNDVALMAIGFSRTTSSFGPLPFDMAVLGAPGCFGHVSLDITELVLGSFGAAHWGMPVPNVAGLIGVPFYVQGFPLDPAANAFGVIASEALAGIVGN